MEDEQYNKIILLRRIILFTVIVLLIVWFVFFIRLSLKVDNNVVDSNYDKNVNMMEDAAKKYFTNDVLKDNKMISLKKMYELNLIEKLKTSDGIDCIDIASFAKVTVLEDKYKLDVVLVCGNNDKTKTTFYDLSCGLSCEKIG